MQSTLPALMDYRCATLPTGVMDLVSAEDAHARVLSRTKAGAFAFFVLAGALLIAALLMLPAGHSLSDGAARSSAPIH
jgi:hypothetical protein